MSRPRPQASGKQPNKRPQDGSGKPSAKRAQPRPTNPTKRHGKPSVEAKTTSSPSNQRPKGKSLQQEEDDFVPPPVGCFGCFGKKPKPKPKSTKNEVAKKPIPPPKEEGRTTDDIKLNLSAQTNGVPKAQPSPIKMEVTPRREPKQAALLPTQSIDSKMAANARPSPREPEEIIAKIGKRTSGKEDVGSSGRASPLSRHESEMDSYGSTKVPPINGTLGSEYTRRGSARPTGSERPLGKEMNSNASPNTASSSSNGFAESNKMYDVCNVRFEKNQFTASGDSVANIGDIHLGKLEEACKQIIQKTHPEARRLARGNSSSTAGALNGHNTSVTSPSPSASSILSLSMSQTLPSQASFSSSSNNGVTGVIFPSASVVPSTKFVVTSITLTEILQLQMRPKEAVAVLSRAIDEVNADMGAMRARKQAAKEPISGVVVGIHANSTYDIDLENGEREIDVKKELIKSDGTIKRGVKVQVMSGKSPPSVEEYEQLRKLKAACHRRIGSLYVSYGKYKEAEDHVLKYMSFLEKAPPSASQKSEIAYTYSVLACIYDQLGMPEKAQAMDYKAIEDATAARNMEL